MSRGKGKSAVAAAAYRSGEKLTNEWDGMTHDYTRKGGVVHTEVTDEMLSYVDVLVDGEFVEAEKDLTLQFRGSRNQRILELKRIGRK